MLTDSEIVIPTESTPAERTARRSPARWSRAPGALLSILGWIGGAGLVVGLVGFNAWWYWRDTRPVADPRAIEAWIGRGDHARAESALRERLRREPHDGETRTALARVLAARGDVLGCARELERVPYWWPRKAESQFRAAQAFLMADRARDAEAALVAIMDTDPLHPPDPGLYHDASQELLKIYAVEDRWDDVYAVIWKVYDRVAPSERLRTLSMRIRAEIDRVSPVERIDVLARYLAADPGDFEALRALANAEQAAGQWARARGHLEDCLRARPEDARGWRDYLALLQLLGDKDAVDGALGRIPPSADAEPETWAFRGWVEEREGRWADAAAHYRRALERNPNLLTALYHMALLEERLGHRAEADALRRRCHEIREAHTALLRASDAFQAALAATEVPEPSPRSVADLRASTRRVASLCDTLGWARLVEALNQCADGL